MLVRNCQDINPPKVLLVSEFKTRSKFWLVYYKSNARPLSMIGNCFQSKSASIKKCQMTLNKPNLIVFILFSESN